MIAVTDDEFESIVARAIDGLHKQFKDAKNVGVVVAEEPTPEQREKLRLRHYETLFGLYEGIPLTSRHSGYSGVIPDKITIFKGPITASVNSIPELEEQVRHTLWHELAHHFGLDHQQIHERETGKDDDA